MNSIYEEFGCKDKEELYLKFITDDPGIKPLKEYMYYYTINQHKGFRVIDTSDAFKEVAMDAGVPNSGHIHILCVDNSGNFRHLLYNKNLNDEYEILSNLIKLDFSVCFTSGLFADMDRIDTLLEKLNNLQINVWDHIYNLDEKLPGHKTYKYDKDISFPEGKRYSILNEYEEFTQTFIKRELLDLNYNYDSEKIMEILCVGLDRYEREILGICICDDNKNIVATDFIYAGTSVSSTVNIREILRKDLNYTGGNFFIFHNHPSGNSQPSREDYMTTMKLMKAAEVININVLDHFVVGHGEFFSVIHNEIPETLNLPYEIKSFFVKDNDIEKEKFLKFAVPKNIVKRNENYNEVTLPEGVIIDGIDVSNKKFYPLKVVDTGNGLYKIPVKENQDIYFDDGKKYPVKKVITAIKENEKNITQNIKFSRNKSISKYKIIEKNIGEEI